MAADRRAIGRRSKRKGKVGERQAAAYLRSLGFDYRRTVQYKGTGDSSDITGDLTNLFIEVKDDKSVKIGTKAWRDAYWRAVEDAGGTLARREAVLLHKERGQWFLTFRAWPLDYLLVAWGGKAIGYELNRLHERRGERNDALIPLTPHTTSTDPTRIGTPPTRSGPVDIAPGKVAGGERKERQ